ncbi:glycosyltransferase family 5 protein [Aaosphaeria arxii CBS 175.79]|uniref:alpha-1,3-glucan synthase n=1 Tax=Aaosphaeria arxii CBS 175.79 TaxID=1450172 RepID=A0A6A5XE72_9PLEO|nr:glycosyltransferase family 5 protein [Aaosphaeria arxii CBS 175.79]KAF2011183.1 glycosyltransferase family 5 protein [Aaosphaeria arxii CBS 175.79]
MGAPSNFLSLLCLVLSVISLRYDPEHEGYNLNLNKTAIDPLDYWGEWENHTFHPSPKNWRFPFYVLTLDRYVDGDPTNNEANDTIFEHDWQSNQFRFGGDAKGLMNNLDYIQGMGIKCIYLSGTPFINMPWSSDGFGALDFTLLDHHHGLIEDWRALITEIHARSMYVILDNTLGTMGDLLQWVGSENVTAPFKWGEYDVRYKTSRQYHDFQISNRINASCKYPRMWGEDGYRLRNQSVIDAMDLECRDSEFDQYGDMKGVGEVPSWETQLAKFAGVQDRLRTWRNDVLEKIMHFSCIQIAMLDIDGFRMDKAAQTPIDVHAKWSDHQRACAKRFGKENFLIVGEIVSKIPYASLLVGRGKEPSMAFDNMSQAVASINVKDQGKYLRPFGSVALDGDAFHYPFYGAMTRFLGLDGPIGLEGVDFVALWHDLLLHEDMANAYTGEFDPRHLWGMTNQDVFRWPALANGTQRHLIGLFIANLMMPGAPFQLWGEEQESYILENQAADYVFGRTPMASQRAWQLHGCYKLGAEVYVDLPFDKALHGCGDDSVSLDHRDPSHFMRNILKRHYELRNQYTILNEGAYLQTLSSQLHDIYLHGSLGMPSPMGIWSIYRGRFPDVQDFSNTGDAGNQGVWIVYSNDNKTVNYTFDCHDQDKALLAPFPQQTIVKNSFYPYEEIVLETSNAKLGIENSTEFNGCISSIEMQPWDYKLFVPREMFIHPRPTITGVVPGHDQRLVSRSGVSSAQTIPIEIYFSSEMNCQDLIRSFSIQSSTGTGEVARLNASSVICTKIPPKKQRYVGQIASQWVFKGTLENVYDGIHVYTVTNVSTFSSEPLYTHSTDHFMFRIGRPENPMVFPITANYSTSLLYLDHKSNELTVVHKATGADKWQYTLNWGKTWSDWKNYTGQNSTIQPQSWVGTKDQKWAGEHVIIRYWSEKAGSMEHVQHGDVGVHISRRWPHMHVTGPWNLYGFDSGLPDSMHYTGKGQWSFDIMTEYPTDVILSTWGINPDGQPDKSKMYGDVDRDGVLDFLPPTSLGKNVINITDPGMPHVGVRIIANDGDLRYSFEPVGSAWTQLIIAILLAIVPFGTGSLAVWLFVKSFYHVKFNELGFQNSRRKLLSGFQGLSPITFTSTAGASFYGRKPMTGHNQRGEDVVIDNELHRRRNILIATMEYEIEDWRIKVKIGGLGVMAALMGKNLQHHNLIWVVPCVGGVNYPVDEVGEPMNIMIMGQVYNIPVQYHRYQNITFVLLDAPVFRHQTKNEPYPSRMDDLESAIYYSAWNQCIAETIRRFPEIEIYHINDYHGALAPLYLLPSVTLPCCLSLHNAEFQGLWSIKRPEDMDEICRVFSLSQDIVRKYVQFGEVFNLLHAAASYLRIHQRGFGAVGVSRKYGKRSFVRYPIFWGLSHVGSLPNPDPSDTAAWDKDHKLPDAVTINDEQEAQRGALRTQAQEWAGLHVDPDAELFVFVGRWSMQKGVDIIADIFPSILERNAKAQLICVGPVIDLHGKFAAMKLQRLMEIYPERVCSKPEFTVLPPCIFSGAEFALIPSRDEPFGLVAVEFGRKGALGIGSRVGGLGSMPGWWFTVESMATRHLVRQFQAAITTAMNSSRETRAEMRARSSLQRFPVAQWQEGLEQLQAGSIKVHERVARARSSIKPGESTPPISTPLPSAPGSALTSPINTRPPSIRGNRIAYRTQSRGPSPSRESSSETSSLNRKRIDDSTGEHVSRPQLTLDVGSAAVSASFTAPHTMPVLSTPIGRIHNYGLFPISIGSGPNDFPNLQEPLSPASMDLRRGLGRASINRHLSRQNSQDSNTSLSSASNSFLPLDTQARSLTTLSSTGLPDVQPSNLTVKSVIGEDSNYRMQKVDPFFTDSQGVYTRQFDRLLGGLNGRTSTKELCIEEFIIRSEKNWFSRFYDAKLGVKEKVAQLGGEDLSSSASVPSVSVSGSQSSTSGVDEFELGANYLPPSGLRKIIQYKIRDWPVYSFLLALGQILAANSYQITLLTGEIGQSATKLYVIASIYLTASVIWWSTFRLAASRYVITLPFLCYGLAFFLLGMAPYGKSIAARGWLQNTATGIYALASGSGSLFFALNFGSEGGTATHSWVFRACAIQGTQQLYVTVLWYWGSHLSSLSSSGYKLSSTSAITNTPYITAITTPIAILFAFISYALFTGLPSFYCSSPGSHPSFYKSLVRRKVIMWFFIVVILQNYFLSAPYGRNWAYLFSSRLAPTWSIILLVVLFFVIVWFLLFFILHRLSIEHSWVLPMFAIGLGAPRWCQILWSTSGMGSYIPWALTPTLGSILGRALWLWLGVLDAVQGVGFGMILLQTMTRFHVAFTLTVAQVVGSLATIAARATAPDRLGPGGVFPNFALRGFADGAKEGHFWGALVAQGVVCVGFAVWFRKEQLCKP